MDLSIKITAEPVDTTTCRFTVDRPVLAGGSYYVGRKELAAASPFAARMFELDGVTAVLVQDARVTVTTDGARPWQAVGPEVGKAIRAHFASGQPAVAADALAAIPGEAELKQRIEHIIAEQINPAVASHGGFVQVIDVKSNEVFLRLGGGCQGCGAASLTLKNGIERVIRDAVPEVGAIMDTTDHAAGRNPYYSPSK